MNFSLSKFFTAALLTSSLAACNTSVRRQTDTLVVALSTAPQDLDPRRATDAVSQQMAGLLFQALVKTAPDLRIVGDAAERWEKTKDGYTFFLQPDLRFTDGAPVTAADIDFSFNEFKKPSNPFAGAFKAIERWTVRQNPVSARPINRDQAVNRDMPESFQLVVQLHLSQPAPTLLLDLTQLRLLPSIYTQKAGADFGVRPLGSGPYELASLGVNDIRLRRRAGGNATMRELIFKIVRDDTTRYLKLRKGEVDLVQNDLPPSKVAEFKKSDQFTVVQTPGLSMAYLLINHQDKDLGRREIRQALATALNVDELITYRLEGLGLRATSILIPEDPYFNRELQWPQHGVETAKKILEKHPLSRQRLVLKCASKGATIENARVIASQFSKLGLDVTVQSYEWGTYYDDIKKGNFELALMRWVGVSDPDIYRAAFHSREFPPGRNRGRYNNPQLDALLDKASQVEDPVERNSQFQKIQRIVFEDWAIIPLWYDLQVAVMQKNVKNFRLPLNGDFSSLLQVTKD